MMALQIQRARRFEIAAPVAFWWSSAEGTVKSGKGITRNISSTGVLVEANDCPVRGVPIQVTIHMPPTEGSEHGMKLQGEGIVTRIEGRERLVRGEGPLHFAASVQFYLEPHGEGKGSR